VMRSSAPNGPRRMQGGVNDDMVSKIDSGGYVSES
jgi:hypothetical protein